MLRILIFAFIGYLIYLVFKNIFGPSKEIDRGPPGRVIDEMVQDPFCKIYIPRRESIKKTIEGEQFFFCSEECASKFKAERRSKQ